MAATDTSWIKPPADDPHEAVRRFGLWRHDPREHDWVGNRFGPVVELVKMRAPPKKNPGGEATRERYSQPTGPIDPWREPRGRTQAAED